MIRSCRVEIFVSIWIYKYWNFLKKGVKKWHFFKLNDLLYVCLFQMRSCLHREPVTFTRHNNVVNSWCFRILSYVRCESRERSSIASGPRFRLLFCSSRAAVAPRRGARMFYSKRKRRPRPAPPPEFTYPPPPALPSLPLITNMTDFTLSRLFPLSPQVATIEMSDTSD